MVSSTFFESNKYKLYVGLTDLDRRCEDQITLTCYFNKIE